MALLIPNLQAVGSGPSLPRADASAAMAPGMALKSVAAGVSDVADVLDQHNQRILAVQNAADLTEIKTKARTAYANFQASLTEDHDYKTYQTKWESALSNLRAEIEKGEYSGMVRDQAGIFLEDFAGDTRIGVSAAMQRKAVERGKLAFGNAFQATVDGYDPASGPPSTAALEELLDDQAWMLPEEKDQQRQRFRDATAAKYRIAEIHADPEDWLERNKEPGPGNLGQWIDDTNRAKGLITDRAEEAAIQAEDMMASGQLTNPDDVDDLFANLRPAAREAIKNRVADRAQLNFRAEMARPEKQQEIVGTVMERIRAYDPTFEDWDAEFVDIQLMIGTLPDGPVRDELASQLKRAKSTEVAQVLEAQDIILKQLDDAFDAQKFGVFERGQSTQSAIDAGLLEDTAKLTAAGFSPEQIEQLNAEGMTAKERTALFRKLWFQRPGDASGLGAYEQTAFEAIAAGETRFQAIDESAMAKARREHGKARMELMEVIRAYPDDRAKWEETARALGVQVEATGLLESEFADEWNTDGGINGGDWENGGILPPLND